MLGYDTLLSQGFLLAWIAVFYGLMYLFNRFVPKGFIILQIAFV